MRACTTALAGIPHPGNLATTARNPLVDLPSRTASLAASCPPPLPHPPSTSHPAASTGTVPHKPGFAVPAPRTAAAAAAAAGNRTAAGRTSSTAATLTAATSAVEAIDLTQDDDEDDDAVHGNDRDAAKYDNQGDGGYFATQYASYEPPAPHQQQQQQQLQQGVMGTQRWEGAHGAKPGAWLGRPLRQPPNQPTRGSGYADEDEGLGEAGDDSEAWEDEPIARGRAGARVLAGRGQGPRQGAPGAVGGAANNPFAVTRVGGSGMAVQASQQQGPLQQAVGPGPARGVGSGAGGIGAGGQSRDGPVDGSQVDNLPLQERLKAIK